MVLMRSRTRASPSVSIFSGVSAAANSAGGALLTPASVACAESTTAMSSVNGLMCLSSPLGSGLAALKRRNASPISAVVHCGSSPAAATWSAAERLAAVLTFAALRARGRRRLCAVLRGALRAILRATLRGVLRAIVPTRCLASHSFGIGSSMAPDNDPAQEPAIFSAVLTPHRSLSRKGFLALMLVAGGASLAMGTTFLLVGAWPVFGFCGLDVLLLYWALQVD